MAEKWFYKMRLYQIGVSVLLICCAASVSADSGWFKRDTRDAVRTYQIQSASIERNEQRIEPQGQQYNGDRPRGREGREYGLPESSGYGGQNDNQTSSSDNMRRQGKMTLEERRALRRQIDEVGHDIYAPRR